jgi:hypothetical protein
MNVLERLNLVLNLLNDLMEKNQKIENEEGRKKQGFMELYNAIKNIEFIINDVKHLF